MGSGVLGWGVGGIEAEAAMLGQPVSMLIPLVVGVKLTGRLREGATATDLVLTITEMLRKHGVVGKFVEYFGPGLQDLPLADRATIANMSPEYGATCGIFRSTRKAYATCSLTGAFGRADRVGGSLCQGARVVPRRETPEARVFRTACARPRDSRAEPGGPEASYRIVWCSRNAGESFRQALPSLMKPKAKPRPSVNASLDSAANQENRWEQEGGNPAAVGVEDPRVEEHVSANVKNALKHGSVVIAAITSCTNTSNPSVLMAAGLLAKKAVENVACKLRPG